MSAGHADLEVWTESPHAERTHAVVQQADMQQPPPPQDSPPHLLQPVVVAEERKVLDGQVAQRAHKCRLPRARSGATTPGHAPQSSSD